MVRVCLSAIKIATNMPALKRLTLFAFAFLILSPAMLYYLQEKLIFLPVSLPETHEFRFPVPFDELFLETPDGSRLNALHFRHDDPKGLLLYFHGNAGNLSRWGTVALPLFDLGYDVLIMDYRTYGKSRGRLSEAALFSDAQLFYDYARKQYNEADILLYGRSLGSGIATWLASENKPSKLLLESPFFSLTEVARQRFPVLPVEWLLKYPLESHRYIQEVACPIFIFHGTADEVVPFQSGLKLFRAVPATNKHLFEVKGGGHNDLAAYDAYWEGLTMALEKDHSNRSEER